MQARAGCYVVETHTNASVCSLAHRRAGSRDAGQQRRGGEAAAEPLRGGEGADRRLGGLPAAQEHAVRLPAGRLLPCLSHSRQPGVPGEPFNLLIFFPPFSCDFF